MKWKTMLVVLGLLLTLFTGSIASAQNDTDKKPAKPKMTTTKHSAAWYKAHRKRHSAAWYKAHRKRHSAAWYRAHRKRHSAAWYKAHSKK